MEKPVQTDLEQLAQQIHRPVINLKEFSHLSAQELTWLNQQLQRTVLEENRKINQHLFQVPFFLRLFFRNKMQR